MRSTLEEFLPYLLMLLAITSILWVILFFGTSSLAAPPPERGAPAVKRFSNETLLLDIELDRYQGRLLSYSIINRPFFRSPELAPPRPYRTGKPVQVSLILHGPGGKRYTQRVEAEALCLDHEPGDPPHETAGTVFGHRGRLAAEVPSIPGFERIEIVYTDGDHRKRTTTVKLEKDKFITAGGPFRHDDSRSAERPHVQ